MANVIDTLFVQIGLDTSQFTAAQKQAVAAWKQTQEAAKDSADAIEAQGERLTEAIAGIKRGAIELLAVFFGARGIKEFITDQTVMNAALGRSAKTLNMSARELSIWQNVAKQTGGSAESMTGSMQGLTDSINRFLLTGQGGDFLQVLNRFGIGLYTSNGQLKTAGQLLLELNHAMQGVDPARAKSLLQMLGLDPATINTILMNEGALRKLIRTQGELGPTTDRDAKAAQELQTAFTQTQTAAVRLGNSILLGLGPPLVWVLDKFTKLFEFLDKLSPNKSTPYGNMSDWAISLGNWIAEKTGSPDRIGTYTGGAGPIGAARGDRNNNPGNIEYGGFAIAHGATGTDGRFAVFPTPAAGEAAMSALLRQSYRGQSLATIQRRWVGNADPNYLAGMEKATGLGPGGVPNLDDPAVLHALMLAMSQGEGTHLGGAAAAAGASRPGGATITHSTSINAINVNVQGSRNDADTIARTIKPAIDRVGLGNYANSGSQ